MYQTFLFDLDGTLLAMDHEMFGKMYFETVSKVFANDETIGAEQYMPGLKAGIIAMKKNNGMATNADAFFTAVTGATGFSDRAYIQEKMDTYYRNVFKTLQVSAKRLQPMVDSIAVLKAAGKQILLATDPLFPKNAVLERMQWAGLNPDDFSHIPTYDFHRFCKPSKGYFDELLTLSGADPAKTLMVGNSVYNDLPSVQAGIDCYLVDDNLLNEKNAPIECAYRSNAEGFLAFAKKICG